MKLYNKNKKFVASKQYLFVKKESKKEVLQDVGKGELPSIVSDTLNDSASEVYVEETSIDQDIVDKPVKGRMIFAIEEMAVVNVMVNTPEEVNTSEEPIPVIEHLPSDKPIPDDVIKKEDNIESQKIIEEPVVTKEKKPKKRGKK